LKTTNLFYPYVFETLLGTVYYPAFTDLLVCEFSCFDRQYMHAVQILTDRQSDRWTFMYGVVDVNSPFSLLLLVGS